MSLEWWEDNKILGGRDIEAGGTWLACSIIGRIAFLTNFREIQKLSHPKSKGDLPCHFLESNKFPLEFAEEILKVLDQYNGFNLVLTDLRSNAMVYVTNMHEKEGVFISEASPGIHVLSNANIDTPWPKAQRLLHNFTEIIYHCEECEVPVIEMVEKLLTNTIKDDETMLPKIYPP